MIRQSHGLDDVERHGEARLCEAVSNSKGKKKQVRIKKNEKEARRKENEDNNCSYSM